jgi:hypothetical protein
MREAAIVETVMTVPGRRNRRLSVSTWADLSDIVVNSLVGRRGGQPNATITEAI